METSKTKTSEERKKIPYSAPSCRVIDVPAVSCLVLSETPANDQDIL